MHVGGGHPTPIRNGGSADQRWNSRREFGRSARRAAALAHFLLHSRRLSRLFFEVSSASVVMYLTPFWDLTRT